ncbi:MAG: LemA family protein [Patescibacteria group bacterium]
MSALYIILVVVAVLALWLIGVYNGLIKLRNRTQEAWSDIDVQLKRRYDLIPNLVETVKGYATHEKETFLRVTEARNMAMKATTPEEKAKAENMLSATLKTLFAVAESYPELKANQNFLQLQDELSDTENKIQASRRFYNGNVRDFNTKIEVFPNNMIAGMLGFKKFEYFEAAEEERKNVKVSFKEEPQTPAAATEPTKETDQQ